MDEKETADNYDGIKGREPVITLFDIETTPACGWYFGKGYETNIIDQERDSYIMSFSHKSLNKKTIRSVAMWDFDDYTPGRFSVNDRNVVFALHALMLKSDIVIAQNGDNFDIRMANSRFLYYGLPPIQDLKSVDTLKTAKRYFNMSFYSLDHLCRYLGIPRKLDPGSHKTWMLCMDGDEKAQNKMVVYNKADVDRLEQVYLRMRGWMKNHPVLNLWTRKITHCPTCMSDTTPRKNGPRLMKTGWKQRWECIGCGAKWQTELVREDPKIDITKI